jgi:hypothetical protein
MQGHSAHSRARRRGTPYLTASVDTTTSRSTALVDPMREVVRTTQRNAAPMGAADLALMTTRIVRVAPGAVDFVT